MDILKMSGDWELDDKSKPKRFFEFAESYLNTSIAQCENIINKKSDNTWSNANPVLFLGAHSIELFFKGAILKKNGSFEKYHSIQKLEETYNTLYDDEYHFDCIFKRFVL